MNQPRIALLVNGGPDSIEAVRARGLTSGYPTENVRFFWREGDRRTVAAGWRKELRAWQPDLIYVLNTAMPGIAVALREQWQHGTPYVIDTGDVVYRMARAAGTESWWRWPMLWLGETLALSRAAAVVVRGTRHKEHLESLGQRRVQVIRDGCTSAPAPASEAVTALRQRLGLEGFLTVGVLGSLVYSPRLQICYGWDLVQALAQLRDLPVKGVVVGDGPGREWLEAQARQYGVTDRIVFCGRIPYADVPVYLRTFDVALSTQTNNLPGRVRTTGKVPEYMAAGCFILASRVGEAELLLPSEMLVDYAGEVDRQYPTRLAERIRTLAAKPDLLALGKQLPAVAEEKCSYRILSEQFRQLIQSL